MSELTLGQAQQVLAGALAAARAKNLSPLAVVVLDSRGALKAAAAEDGVSLLRWRIALAKAYGAVALGIGSRKISQMAVERPHFVAAAGALTESGMVPVAGGVLVRDAHKHLVGAVGISGDTSDNDEDVAITAISDAGLLADPG
jgi:uncharacterized protein GlcG (DUF336 family)